MAGIALDDTKRKKIINLAFMKLSYIESEDYNIVYILKFYLEVELSFNLVHILN